jgi:hypothetical protein
MFYLLIPILVLWCMFSIGMGVAFFVGETYCTSSYRMLPVLGKSILFGLFWPIFLFLARMRD